MTPFAFFRMLAARLALLLAGLFPMTLLAQEQPPAAAEEEVPVIFWDKAPQVIAFQLNRLTVKQLVKIERKSDDAKYRPLFETYLTRKGIPAKVRAEGLAALVKLNKSDEAAELIAAIGRVDAGDAEQAAVLPELSTLLLRHDSAALGKHRDKLDELAAADNIAVKRIAFAGLAVAIGKADDAWQLASEKDMGVRGLMAGLSLVPDAKLRSGFFEKVRPLIGEALDEDTQRAAIEAASFIPMHEKEAAAALAALIAEGKLVDAAAPSLRRIDKQHWNKDNAAEVGEKIVAFVEATPIEGRTAPAVLDAVELGKELAAMLPAAAKEKASAIRKSLNDLGVQVVQLKTINEEMRYDRMWFAVQAGKPVMVVLHNEDSMPHNFVLVAPGSIEEIGKASENLQGQAGDPSSYVPKSEKVLAFSATIPPNGVTRFSFTAPAKAGVYEYVCTFPGHWSRMYGSLVVVDDLEAFEKSPKEPADPLYGDNKPTVVADWTMDQLKPLLAKAADKGNAGKGAAIFQKGSCHLCHKVGKVGGAVGPELTEVFKKYKNERSEVLKQIIEPSAAVDPKFQLWILDTLDGIIAGLILAEDDKSVTVIDSPQNPKPKKIPKDEISDRRSAKGSMMPAKLLNNFTPEQIADLLMYLESGGGHGAGHEHH